MHFAFTTEEDAFRREIQEFARAELPQGWVGPTYNDEEWGDEEFWTLGEKMAVKVGKKGWLSLTWPREYGGQSRSPVEHAIFKEEMSYNRVPGIDVVGGGIVAPTLLAFGTDEQKRRRLPGIARGDQFWCQGFSEPEAGSDLAALKTQAVERDDCFVVNGQKVWTSGAHKSQWMMLLVRTDPDAPKHRGISVLLVDMKTPGISIRPLINIIGGHAFNEVFLDNVRVPRENLVSEKNQGWRVVTSALNFERSGIERVGYSRRALADIAALVRGVGPTGGLSPEAQSVRRRLVDMEIECEVARLFSYRVAWMESKGITPECEAAMSKLLGSELMQHVAQTGMQALGLYGQLAKGSIWAYLEGSIEHLYLSSLGRTIGAGTSEIQRNQVAIRGLGLPRG
ncbi:MAG: acyl-CoA dehydrogenase family protein [Dehalococcoidia bacterium]|nr:acyl-CoA dehydrogenase family protein [Dehalococcoidia bacterium]